MLKKQGTFTLECGAKLILTLGKRAVVKCKCIKNPKGVSLAAATGWNCVCPCLQEVRELYFKEIGK